MGTDTADNHIALTDQQARSYSGWITARNNADIIEPTDPTPTATWLLLDGFGMVAPVLKPMIASIRDRAQRTSVTIPTPLGTKIYLSTAAVSSPRNRARTAAHEATHAHWIMGNGNWQTAVDYIGSKEIEATREAHGYAAELFVDYLVTAYFPTPDEAMASLASDTYHLDPADIELARGIIESAIDAMRLGALPPLIVAKDSLDWFQKNAPEAIMAAPFRPQH